MGGLHSKQPRAQRDLVDGQSNNRMEKDVCKCRLALLVLYDRVKDSIREKMRVCYYSFGEFFCSTEALEDFDSSPVRESIEKREDFRFWQAFVQRHTAMTSSPTLRVATNRG